MDKKYPRVIRCMVRGWLDNEQPFNPSIFDYKAHQNKWFWFKFREKNRKNIIELGWMIALLLSPKRLSKVLP